MSASISGTELEAAETTVKEQMSAARPDRPAATARGDMGDAMPEGVAEGVQEGVLESLREEGKGAGKPTLPPEDLAGQTLSPPPSGRRGCGQGDAFMRLEDCYPPRREDEVRLLRRQRDRHYQLELQRQIEEKRRLQQQRRRDEVRADLLRLGAANSHDEYVRKLHSEQRLQLQRQLQHQLNREEHREEQRMQQVTEARERQREQFRSHQGLQQGLQASRQQGVTDATPTPQNDQPLDQQVHVLSERLQTQLHLPEDDPRPPSQREQPRYAEAERAHADVRDGQAPAADPADITEGVAQQVKLDERRPWNHYQALQKELSRRRRERAAQEAAKEAAAARRAEAADRARKDAEYRRYLDWRLRCRRAGPGQAGPLTPRREAARRWAEAEKQAVLHRRAQTDAHLAEWRRAKLDEEKGRKAAASAARRAEREAAEEKQRRARDSFARWLDTVHERRLAENAGPVGATGVTTYEAFHAAPWPKLVRGRRKSVA